MIMNEKKFELSENTITIKHPITSIDIKLYQIRSLIDFILINNKPISKGDLGGWIEKETNLSQTGLCLMMHIEVKIV